MAKALSALLGGLLLATTQAANARVLDLPLYDPDRGMDRVPSYASDRVEVTLTTSAARRLPLGARGWRRLGLQGIDAVADEMGVLSFEREFPGEVPVPGQPDFTRYLIVRLRPGADVGRVLDRLASLPMVERADPIGIMPVNRVPNDSLYASSYWYDRIHGPQAWDVSVGDPNILIAIVDTGVLPWHPDLGGTQPGGFGNLWVNPAERSGQVGRDDDGNGFVDDVWGWDFVTGESASAAPCEDAEIPDNDPSDFDGHGTMLSGLVAGLTDNTIGVAGGTWNCRIMALRAGWHGNLGGFVAMDFCAQAIRYATRMGAHVINCSWSSSNTGGLGAAVYAAVRNGIVITVAAGNNGATALYLQQRADCIDVSATDNQDRVPRGGSPWFWSANVGPEVDLCAPGDNITSTFTLGLTATPCASPPRFATYTTLDGTSFSAPLVASAAALVQSYRHQQGLKLLTPESMRLRLMETADDISAQNPTLVGQIGAGRLDVYRALTDPPTSWANRMSSLPAPGVVVLPSISGKARLAFVTSDKHLLILSGAGGDTLLDVTVPAVPTTGLSAATLGPGGEVALFFGGRNGRAYAYHLDGTPLTAWPRNAAGALLVYGPALADLDGDGIPEAVFTGDDGDVYAWHADGSDVAGFPVATSAPFADGPALADLDGDGKAEVIAASSDGQVWVWEGDGNLRAGAWPVALGGSSPPAPVIGRITAGGAPAIVVGDGIGNVSAFDAAGALMTGWPVNLGTQIPYGLALGNVVGDSLPEVVVPTASEVFILTGTGTQASPPISPGATVRGAPGLADVTGDGLADILFTAGRTILAYRGTGSAIAGWGRRAGDYATGLNYFVVPTMGDFDGDGRTEVWAGADTSLKADASDTTLYCYDAGPGTFSPSGQAWATARGNPARTGALGAPALPALDDVAPAAVLNLDAVGATDTTVALTWTAVGNDGLNGTAASYDLRFSNSPINENNFASAAAVSGMAAPLASGSPESKMVGSLASSTHYYFALRVRDQAGNASPLSNVVDTTTAGAPGPLAGIVGPALRIAPHPARGQVHFYYRGEASTPTVANRIEVYDITGRLIQRLEQGTRVEGNFTWNGKDEAGDLVPAGIYFARLVSGSTFVKTRLVWMP